MATCTLDEAQSQRAMGGSNPIGALDWRPIACLKQHCNWHGFALGSESNGGLSDSPADACHTVYKNSVFWFLVQDTFCVIPTTQRQ